MTPEQEKESRAYQDQRRKWRAAKAEIEAGVVKAYQ
jgi:hypothetical protein